MDEHVMIDRTAEADTRAALEALKYLIAGSPAADGELQTERLAVHCTSIIGVPDDPEAEDPVLIAFVMGLRFDEAVTLPQVDGVTMREPTSGDPRFAGAHG